MGRPPALAKGQYLEQGPTDNLQQTTMSGHSCFSWFPPIWFLETLTAGPVSLMLPACLPPLLFIISETPSPPLGKTLPPSTKADRPLWFQCNCLRRVERFELGRELRLNSVKRGGNLSPAPVRLSRSRFNTTLRNGQVGGLPVDAIPFRRNNEVVAIVHPWSSNQQLPSRIFIYQPWCKWFEKEGSKELY